MAASAPYIGSKTGKVDLDEAVFGEAFHEPLVHRAVMAELNARRQGTHSTKTRGEVAMTGAKAWRQKGTGRARVGALSAPQRTGGGIAFGPKPRSYTVKVNRKERRRALRAALSVHAERGIARRPWTPPPSTRRPPSRPPRRCPASARGRALVVLVEGEENAALSFRNIDGVHVLRAGDVGVADVIGAARLVASPAAFERAGQGGRRAGQAGGGGMNPRTVIIKPVISEKSYALLAANKYTFRVHDKATKTQVRQAIEEIFGVRVQGVRTQNVKPKPKRRGFHSGYRRSWKKAVVTLHPEDSIELFEGQEA